MASSTHVRKQTNVRSGIPRSGIPSDWSILTGFLTSRNSDAAEKCDMVVVTDLSMSGAVFLFSRP